MGTIVASDWPAPNTQAFAWGIFTCHHSAFRAANFPHGVLPWTSSITNLSPSMRLCGLCWEGFGVHQLPSQTPYRAIRSYASRSSFCVSLNDMSWLNLNFISSSSFFLPGLSPRLVLSVGVVGSRRMPQLSSYSLSSNYARRCSPPVTRL